MKTIKPKIIPFYSSISGKRTLLSKIIRDMNLSNDIQVKLGDRIIETTPLNYTPMTEEQWNRVNAKQSKESEMYESAAMLYSLWKKGQVLPILQIVLNYYEAKYFVVQSTETTNVHSKMKLLFNLAGIRPADVI